MNIKLWWQIRKGRKDNLHQYLKQNEATLHIIKSDYAYLEVGNRSYYFHNSNPRVVRYQETETMSGEKLTKSLLPYDGWSTLNSEGRQ